MSPSGPLTPPGVDAGQDFGPGAGGAPISPQDAQPAENPEADMMLRQIITASRRIAAKYPTASLDCRTINDAVARIMQKIAQSRPAPEPLAPPV